MTRRRWVREFVAGMLVAVLVAGAVVYRQHKRYRHFAVHDPGRVYRSAWLEADVIEELIRRYQLRTVLNLCRPGEMGEQRWVEEREAARRAGARLIELSMPTDPDPDDPRIAEFVAILQDPETYPLLVHCQHGVLRTAKLLSIYDIVCRDRSAEDSLSVMPLFGRDDHNPKVWQFALRFDRRQREPEPAHTRTAGASPQRR